jgi:hypothetical protein
MRPKENAWLVSDIGRRKLKSINALPSSRRALRGRKDVAPVDFFK